MAAQFLTTTPGSDSLIVIQQQEIDSKFWLATSGLAIVATGENS